MTETERLIRRVFHILDTSTDENYQFKKGIALVDISTQILRAFNQWLEEQGASHRVKCPYCSYSQFTDGEAVGMSPCNECNGTGYILEPLRLEEDE